MFCRSVLVDHCVRFSPGFFNQKNSLRNLQFDSSCLTRSPNRSADCSGEECASFVEIQSYTWLELSQIAAVDCIPAGSNCSPMSVQEKELVVVVIKKCHQLTFVGTQYFLSGPSGERAGLLGRTTRSIHSRWSERGEPREPRGSD